MAIRSTKKNLSSLELIARNDDALDAGGDYAAYLKELDQAHLKFKDGQQPTRFILNFELSGKESERIKNAMVSGKDEDGEPTMALGSWQFQIARHTLKAITNPTDLPPEDCLVMKLDDRGLVHDELLGKLEKHGIIQDIFAAYSAMVLTSPKGSAKN